ncbi:NAD(P)-binding protein [Mycena sanguinolenta]|uniref:NAD(P)-binding protein n=1 Tax=Mycena sanguinolenta TaxID=230812 RepID=A0A8H6XZR8_9AGAR|nr:NAD(P)-binding protein [Mycena sanguinolenta]
MSTFSQIFPPEPKFSVDHIPDLSGKVMLVTGGNAGAANTCGLLSHEVTLLTPISPRLEGIGKETVKALLAHNAKVYLGARNRDKACKVIAELKTETNQEAEFLLLDLADLPSIKAAAEEFMRKETKLHVLFNNGGVMIPPVEQVTAQGYDLQFGTNVLGHFYLTTLLLPTILATAASAPRGTVRIIHTSSFASQVWGNKPIEYASLKDSTGFQNAARKQLGPTKLYQQSKFGNVIFSNELHRHFAEQGVVSVSLHPGIIRTELDRHRKGVAKVLIGMLQHSAPRGALTQLWAGTSQEGAKMGGKYLIPFARYGSAPELTSKPEVGRELWKWCEEQVAAVN